MSIVGDELPTDLPIVFGSCLGSLSVLFSLLDQMADDDGGVSPIRFSGSVHHAPVSAIGISAKHTGVVSAVSANEDLAAMVLIEGLAVAREYGRALVVVGDESWPAAFGLPLFEPYAAAILLQDDPERSFAIERADQTFIDDPTLPAELLGNPSARIEMVLRWAPGAARGDILPLAAAGSGCWVIRCL